MTKFVCRKGRRVGQVIDLVGIVTNRDHKRYADVRYVNATPGQRRRSGIISARELRRNWEQVAS